MTAGRRADGEALIDWLNVNYRFTLTIVLLNCCITSADSKAVITGLIRPYISSCMYNIRHPCGGRDPGVVRVLHAQQRPPFSLKQSSW